MLNENELSAVQICFWINLIVWLISVAVTFGRFRIPTYHPIVICQFYHFMGYIYRPFIIWTTQKSDLWNIVGFVPDTPTIFLTTIVANLAYISLLTGFLAVVFREKTIHPISPTNFVIEKPVGFYCAVAIIIVLGCWSTYRSFGEVGLDAQSSIQVTVDDSGGQRLSDVSGYELAFSQCLPAICILLYLIPTTRKLSYLVISLFLVNRLYIGVGRNSILAVCIALFMIFLVNQRRRYPSASVLIAIVLLGVVFDVIGNDRLIFRRLYFSDDIGITNSIEKYQNERSQSALSSDMCEFDVSSSVLSLVPERTGWSYGSQYLRLLIWPIPRQLWPDKPVNTNIVNFRKYGNFFGLTTSIYTDAYSVIGAPGLVIILFGVGFYLAFLYEKARTTLNGNWYLYFWCQIMYVTVILRDGGVNFVFFVAFSMLAMWVANSLGGLRLCRETDL